MALDALLSDDSLGAHGFNALHKKFSGGSHESDGNCNGAKANPRAGLWVLLRKIALHCLESFRSARVECESIVFAGRVV